MISRILVEIEDLFGEQLRVLLDDAHVHVEEVLLLREQVLHLLGR